MPIVKLTKHRLTTLRKDTNFPNEIIDYVMPFGIDEKFYLELWFINRTLMWLDR